MENTSQQYFVINQQDIDFTQRASMRSIIDYTLCAAGRDADTRGFSVTELNGDNHTWVLSRYAIELAKLPLLGDTLKVRTWVSDCTRLLSTRNFCITNQDGDLVANAISQWCIIDLNSRLPINLTVLDIVCQDEPSPIAKPIKIDSRHTTTVRQHQTRYSDLDFNCHVNTLRYIDMILDVLPIDMLRHDGSIRFDIQFNSESKLDELLDIKYAQSDNTSSFEISHQDNSAAVKAQIIWEGGKSVPLI